jgi:hypothetical protein
MQAANRAGRFSARLGLESLEGRMLLSATLPAAPSGGTAVAHPADAFAVNHLATTSAQAQATYAHFSYDWHVGPSAVLVGTNSTTLNGKSTGSVDFALVRRGNDALKMGGQRGALPIGFVMTTSSADPSHPDHFHVSFTVTLKLHDDASGKTGVLTFHGTVDGTLDWMASHLTITFQSPLTQSLTLGHNVYKVTLPSTIKPTGPNDVPTPLYAFVQVSAARK